MITTVDVGHTLGIFETPGTGEVLEEIAQAPRQAREIDRTILHVTPDLTDDIAQRVRELLLIDEQDWRQRSQTGGFTAYDGATGALRQLARLGPVATLSNVSCIAGPRRMRDLHEQCGEFLFGIYTSYELAARKPQPRGWQTIAADLDAQVSDIVHIGDRVDDDVRGSLAAGCRAAILVTTRGEELPADLTGDPRITVVPDIVAAAEHIAGMPEARR